MIYWIQALSPDHEVYNKLVLPHEDVNKQAADLVRDGYNIARVEDLQGREYTRRVFHYLVREEQMNL